MGKHRDRRNEANAKHYAAVSASKNDASHEKPVHFTAKIDNYDENLVNSIARLAHNVNRAYCESIGDFSFSEWESAPDWQQETCRNGVRFHLDNTNASPCESHANWLREKEKDGWKFGEVKDVEKKEHPCFRPYEELPQSQRTKDFLFIGVVRSFIIMQKTGE